MNIALAYSVIGNLRLSPHRPRHHYPGAELAAGELRQETDNKAQGIISEATRRADSLVAGARRQAGVR